MKLLRYTPVLFASIFLVSCGSDSEKNDQALEEKADALPETFQNDLGDFIKEGIKLSALSSNSSKISDSLIEQHANAVTAYKLAESSWPDGYCDEARSSFSRSLDIAKLAFSIEALRAQLASKRHTLAGSKGTVLIPGSSSMPDEMLVELKSINPDCISKYEIYDGSIADGIDVAQNLGVLFEASSSKFEEGQAMLKQNGFVR